MVHGHPPLIQCVVSLSLSLSLSLLSAQRTPKQLSSQLALTFTIQRPTAAVRGRMARSIPARVTHHAHWGHQQDRAELFADAREQAAAADNEPLPYDGDAVAAMAGIAAVLSEGDGPAVSRPLGYRPQLLLRTQAILHGGWVRVYY
jgi:hypothetical protein